MLFEHYIFGLSPFNMTQNKESFSNAMKMPYFLSSKTLSLTAAGLLGAGIPCLPAQEVQEASSGTAKTSEGTTESTGETAPLIVADALKALWEKGGATDFSDAAWTERLGTALDRWDSVAGKTVADLTGSDAFYGTAGHSERLESLAYNPAQSIADHANGVRLRGLLVIPADGEYSFALAGDDAADLYLGAPGGSRFTKKKELSVPRWTNDRDWSRYRTAGKAYKAGDVVWVEVIGKNDEGIGGGEHVSVAWKKPGDTEYSLIPSTLPDGKVALTTPPLDPEDPNDIGVPQSWLGSVGLGNLPAGNPAVRLYGDEDGDGFNLLEEYQTGGRPDAVGGNTGYFSVEKWTGTNAGSVDAFTKSERFLQPASEARRQEGGLDLADGGDNYFIRLRSLVVPPLTGEWTFYLAGDDTARLLVSPDGQRFLKKTVAEVNLWTDRYQWTKSPTQKSAPMAMQAGTGYFLEALQYQQGGGANVAVAWQYKTPNLSQMEGTTATQSSTMGDCPADCAIDGSLDTQSHTNWTEGDSWWQMDFALPQAMNQVVIYNRTDGSNGQRLSNFRLSVLDANGEELAGQDFYTEAGTYAGETVEWSLPETVQGKSVRIQGLGINNHGDKFLCLKEVAVYEQNEYSRAPVLISGDHVQTIPAEPNDQDNNSIPDDWQAEKGLVAGQNGLTEKDCSEYGDPDEDLVPNFAEYLLDTNPLVPSGAPGYLTQEMWWGVAGWSIDDAIKMPEVLGKAPIRNLLKDGLPARNLGDNYLRRLRGTIKPPVTGEYTFWISSDETSILYLSPDDRKFKKKEIARVGYGPEDRGVYLTEYNNWDAFPKQRSKPIRLEAGKEYFIEADHKQYHAVNHLQIAWQMPGGEREMIPGEYLSSFGGDLADRDDDDLPDDWEKQYGIDPEDKGGKDFNNGAWGDPYKTGITNREAYLMGWDPRTPSLPDFGDSVVDIPVTGGTASGGGMWAQSGNGIITPTGRGSLTYNVSLPAKGRFLLEITATPTGNVLEIETLGFTVEADGKSLGSNTLRSIRGAAGKVLFLLPELEAGAHSVKITLQNTDLRRTFVINSIRILKPEGQSADGCEVPEWLHQYLGKENGLTNCPAASLTSPVCIEGKARALHLADVKVNGTAQKIEAGAGTGWYANIALPADGSELPVTASFESGAHDVNSRVKWAACDVLAKAEISVRKGDSLRLCVGGEESTEAFPVTYTVGSGTLTGNSNAPVAVKFDTAGLQTVRADWKTAGGADASATMEVKVVTVELGEAMDLITGLRRNVVLYDIPDEVLLRNEAPLRVDKALGDAMPGARRLNVTSDKGGAQHLIARLGENGAILDTKAFFSHTNSSTSTLSRVEPIMDYGDGSSLMCLYLASESLPEGGYVRLSLMAGGVQFMNGKTTLDVKKEDFGEDGLYRVMMLVPAGTSTSICHVIRYYDKDGNEL